MNKLLKLAQKFQRLAAPTPFVEEEEEAEEEEEKEKKEENDKRSSPFYLAYQLELGASRIERGFEKGLKKGLPISKILPDLGHSFRYYCDSWDDIGEPTNWEPNLLILMDCNLDENTYRSVRISILGKNKATNFMDNLFYVTFDLDKNYIWSRMAEIIDDILMYIENQNGKTFNF